VSQYCTESDVRNSAIQGLFTNQSRQIGVPVSGRFELDGHGYVEGQAVKLRSDSALPSPLVEGVDYYVKAPDEFSFSVSATVGGAAITPATAGEAMVYSTLPFSDWIEWASAIIDAFLPAHVLPLTAPYHELIVSVTAQLAAAKGLQFVGGAQQDILALQKSSQQVLDKWAKNQPIRGQYAPRSSLLAVVSSVAAVDPRGYYPPGGGLP